MTPPLLYPDTSVFGGPFDPEFASASDALFDAVARGRFRLLISTTTASEIARAPTQVRALARRVFSGPVVFQETSPEMHALRDAYIAAGVLGRASMADALHVASASVGGADMIVSWNFKHIVNYQRIRGFHAVNAARGYPALEIYSPLEVVG